MFKNTIQMPVIANAPQDFVEVSNKVDQVIKDQDTINQMRMAMLAHAYHFERTATMYCIPEDISSYAQNVFVQERQKEAQKGGDITTDDTRFHTWLTLARYMSLIEGDLMLKSATFDRAVQLEKTRLERCPKPVAATNAKVLAPNNAQVKTNA